MISAGNYVLVRTSHTSIRLTDVFHSSRIKDLLAFDPNVLPLFSFPLLVCPSTVLCSDLVGNKDRVPQKHYDTFHPLDKRWRLRTLECSVFSQHRSACFK